MSIKTASTIASFVTVLLVIVVVIFFAFGGMVMLNGLMNADPAVYTGFACFGLMLILCPILAWRLVNLFITRFNWNNALAMILSVVASTLASIVMGIATLFIVLFVADSL
jgi:hypothetical protein